MSNNESDNNTVEANYSRNKNPRKPKTVFPHKFTKMSFMADNVAKKFLDAHKSDTRKKIKKAMRSLRHFTTRFKGIKHHRTMKKINKSHIDIYRGSDIKNLGIDAHNQIILRDVIIPKMTRRLFNRLTKSQKRAIISAFRRKLVLQSGPKNQITQSGPNNQITRSRTIPSSKTSVTPP